MLRIALIRAGSSDFDDQERVQGRLNVPLSAQGESEAHRVASSLSSRRVRHAQAPSLALPGSLPAPTTLPPADLVDWVVSAPALSSRQTADRIGATLELPVKECAGLEEVHLGLWEGCRWDEVRRKHPKVCRQWEEGCGHLCPPGGETLQEARERVVLALSALFRRYRKGTMALVVPRLLYRLVERVLADGACGAKWEAVSAQAVLPELPPVRTREGAPSTVGAPTTAGAPASGAAPAAGSCDAGSAGSGSSGLGSEGPRRAACTSQDASGIPGACTGGSAAWLVPAARPASSGFRLGSLWLGFPILGAR